MIKHEDYDLILNSIKNTFLKKNDSTIRKELTDSLENLLHINKFMPEVNYFKIVCDETNNPPSLIDKGELVIDFVPTIPKRVKLIKSGELEIWED